MIDPEAIVKYGWPVTCITVLTLVGKLLSTTIGAIVSGQSLKQSVQVGMSMAQIGEFAFIVATLGLSLGVISDFLFPIAVGVSAITTFTTPYLIKASEPLSAFLERVLPRRWVVSLNNYSSATQHIQVESEWQRVVKFYITVIAVNAIVVIGLLGLSLNFLLPFLNEKIASPFISKIVTLIISLACASPFLWALMAKKTGNLAYKEIWLNRSYNRGPLFLLEFSRVLTGTILISFWVFRIFDTLSASIIVIVTMLVILFVFARRIKSFYLLIETRFLGNLNARENAEYNSLAAHVSRKNASIESALSPWDAHIVQLEVPQHTEYIGRKLSELSWREKYGINIVYIKRGEHLIHLPDRNSFLLPYDSVGVLATDAQIKLFKPVFDLSVVTENESASVNDIVLKKFIVDEHTGLKGKSLRDSGLREKTNGLVIGIERKNNPILNPESSIVFEWDDVVWIVGDKKSISGFLNKTKV